MLYYSSTRTKGGFIISYILKENILLNQNADHWSQAILIAGQPLIETNYIKKSYLKDIIKNVKKYGPYMVITNGIVLSHSKNKNNVFKTGFGVTTFENNIVFNCENDPVKVIFTITKNNDLEYLILMKKIVEILSSQNTIDKILKATSKDEIYNLIKKIN